MSELLPDHLSFADTNVEDCHTNKTKHSLIDNIIDWIQCFSIYIAVLSHSAPHCVPDLLGYQSLIISASQYHHTEYWVAYDRRFRLKVSVKNIKVWSAIIWNNGVSRLHPRDLPTWEIAADDPNQLLLTCARAQATNLFEIE